MAKAIQVREVTSGRRGFLTDTEYNRSMEAWARETQRLAKAQAAMLAHGKKSNHTYRKGKKAGKTEGKLRNHIQFQMKSDGGEVAGVIFQFPVHGIFKEHGVAKGYPAHGHVRRSLSEWLSATLERQDEKLVDIVAEFHADKFIHTFRTVGQKTI